ncbi:EamA family transporter [Sulfurospirillum arsenophilum]|uniref:EamA family transporter n=1 Tax=Sulfurospirillum arsenophilum TaxID=56698 RepID=UPI0005AAFEDD|nr:EamA family transporter [Sulfurospirillum arsenophilum]
MPLRHILIALSVVVIWGVNFVVIQVALQEIPPLLLTFLRFFFATFPAIFFFKRPKNTSWKMLFCYSLSMFILDFAFLFSGMYVGVSSGIASLALQTQVFFTAILAVIFLKEKMTLAKIIGAIIAFSGIVFVGFHSGGDVNLLGLLLVECAALSWAIGNLVSKQIGKVDMLSLVVWGSFISLPFLLALSYIFESHLWHFEMFTHLSGKSIGAIAYLAYPVTFFGFGIWSWLLSRYPATTVVPFTLLVPVVGFSSSALLVGEALPSWKLIAAFLIVFGLVINLYGERFIKRS